MNSTKHSRYALTIPVALAILMIANPVMAASLMGSKAVRLDLLSSVTYDGSATAISISTPLTSLAFGSTGSLVGNGLAAGGLLYEDPTMVQTQFANAETPTSNGMVVNALDLSTVDGVQVLVSSVSASVSSLSLGLSPGSSAVQVGHSSFIQPMHAIITCPDFVTGGGWITVTDGSGNDKGTFGFVAGCKNGGTNP